MESARGAELIYWFFSVTGTFFFLFRLVAMVWGGFGADPGGGEGGGHGDGPIGDTATHGPHSHDGTDAAFKLISLQSLTGFFMTFGWAGLAAQKQFGFSTTVSFLLALLAGGLAMFLTAYLFKVMSRLNSSGDVFSIEKTLKLTGSVYVRIPADGRGQVRLSVNNATRFVDAISEDRVDLESFSDVSVVRVVDGTTVSVKKLK